MVGVGPRKNRSILARVAVLGEDGRVIIDEYVAATERVTDYRTRYSGIRARDLVGAPRFENVRQRVAAVLRGKILVGHAVQNDLKVLDLPHPPALIRDTSVYPGLRKELASVFDRCAPTHPTRHQLCLRLCVCASADGGRAGGRHDPSQAPSLKKLCEHVLGKRIQQGEHCPVEDAAHTLELYLRHRERWEAEILQGS
jgi:RNA exonuclease 4